MSLRTVHLFFIISVIGLFLFCAAYTFQNYHTSGQNKDLILSIISVLASGAFVYYFIYAFKALKKAQKHAA